jgi:hypothetical protein
MMGRLTIRDTRPSLAPALLSGLFPYWPREKRRPSVARSGDLLPPSSPAEKATARQDQAGKASTDDGAGSAKPSAGMK